MDKAKKNTVIHAAADCMTANYKSSQIPMYGDALRMPNRNAVIEIIRDCQKLIFPVYYGDRDLLKLPPEQYSALLMEHIHEKLTRQITLTIAGCDDRRALPFHKMLLNGELPLTMGGGIGQSRLCMLLIGTAHIGEVQVSLWDEATRKTCEDAGVMLL